MAKLHHSIFLRSFMLRKAKLQEEIVIHENKQPWIIRAISERMCFCPIFLKVVGVIEQKLSNQLIF